MAGLFIRNTRDRADHDAARFRLPPGVHDRAFAFADVCFIPMPRFFVDRFTNAAEHAQRMQRIGEHMIDPMGHQAPDRSRCRVENAHCMLVHDLPKAPRIRKGGHALEHHLGGTRQRGAVGDVAVAGDPTHIGSAEEHIALLDLEHVTEAVVGIDHVATHGVHHALRLTRAAAGIQDEERVLGIHGFGGAIRVDFLQLIVQPHIAVLHHVYRPFHAFGHDHLFHALALLQGLIHHCFHGHLFGAAEHAIAAKHGHGFGIIDTIGQALRTETTEHHAVYGPDPRTRQNANH